MFIWVIDYFSGPATGLKTLINTEHIVTVRNTQIRDNPGYVINLLSDRQVGIGEADFNEVVLPHLNAFDINDAVTGDFKLPGQMILEENPVNNKSASASKSRKRK